MSRMQPLRLLLVLEALPLTVGVSGSSSQAEVADGSAVAWPSQGDGVSLASVTMMDVTATEEPRVEWQLLQDDSSGNSSAADDEIQPAPAFDRAARAAFMASMAALALALLVLCIFGCMQLDNRTPAAMQQSRGSGDPRSERTTVQRWAHGIHKRQMRLQGRLRALTTDFTSPGGYQTYFPPFFFTPTYLQIAVVVIPLILLILALTVWASWLEESFGLTSDDVLKYASIPFVCVVFTYAHIWAALYMTFYPLQYRGYWQIPGTNMGLGWQGIVPSKAESMARTSVSLMTEKLISVVEVFKRVDPDMLAKELDPFLQGTLTQIVESVANQEEPLMWARLPESVKEELILKAREGVPEVIKAMCEEMAKRIDETTKLKQTLAARRLTVRSEEKAREKIADTEVFDMEQMVVDTFVKDPGLLNHMFIKCGYDELKFIRDCGGYMGIGLGFFQMGLWVFYSEGWMLPVFGLVAGLVSNWAALKMIFEPVEPVPLCFGCVELQGLFLKRQAQVSEEYGKIIAANVLCSKNLIPAIIRGRCSDKLFELVHKHIQGACDDYTGMTRLAIMWFAGQDKYNHCKALVAKTMAEKMEETLCHVESSIDHAMDLETLITERLALLPAHDFEGLLHPVFQEDEWKLVLMGGVLGVLIGCFQWWALGA